MKPLNGINNGCAILFPKTSNGEWGFVAEFPDSEGTVLVFWRHGSLKQILR